MKALKLVGGDFVFDGQNNLMLVDGDDEFIQSIEEILRVNMGEWFINPLHGFNRFEILSQKPYDQEYTIDLIYTALLQESRIDTIESLDLTFDRAKRELTIDFAVVKTTGELVEGGVVV